MNVCIISKWDCTGGAPIATYRLFRALQKHAHVTYLVNKKSVNDQNIHTITSFERHKKTYYESLIQNSYVDRNRTSISNTFFTITYNGADLRNNQIVHEADVINLHWVEKFLSLESINYLTSLGKPVVWTLHDERPYTGGCHYTSGCEEFANNQCSSCRQLITDKCKLPNAVLVCKENIVKRSNLTVVSPSLWLAREAAKSSVFSGKRIEVIPNSVEAEVHYPRNKQKIRDKLGISKDAFVILSGSIDNNEIRKGYKYYIDALKYCLENDEFHEKSTSNKIVIITFGGKTDIDINHKIKHIDIGYVSEENVMAEIYSAADIYVITTLEDNLPNTILESMACGTPIVGFDTGGICDVVINGVNGVLVQKGDAKALGESILMLQQQTEKLKDYELSAVKSISGAFTQMHQSERYMELFRNLSATEKEYDAIDEASIYNCSLQQVFGVNLLYRAGVLIRWVLRRLYLIKV